jgi:hypothetical protein
MEREIRIVASGIEVEALLSEADIANRVWQNFRITSTVNTSGVRYTFPLPWRQS